MIKILKITWLSLPAKEAEVEVGQDISLIKVFSCPCDYKEGQELNDYLYPLEVEKFQKSDAIVAEICKVVDSYFGYKIVGRIDDFDNSIISVGEIKFKLHYAIPSWARGDELIQFYTDRVDLW